MEAAPLAPAPPAEPIAPVVAPPPPPAEPPPVTLENQAARAAEPPSIPADEEPVFTPSLKIGIGLRAGLSLAVNPGDTTFTLSDSLDQFMFRPFFAGQLTKRIGTFVQLSGGASGIGIIDAYAELKLIPEFQILLGQHIPANDRNNFCGPFFNNSWNFAAVHTFPTDAAARDRGFTFWGMIADGILKYHLSMVDLQPGRQIGHARFAARVNFDFLDPEEGYYLSETYFGKKDVLAVGAIISYQNGMKTGTGVADKNGDGKIDNDFVGFSADLLFEKNFGSGGTFSLQAMYWNWNATGEDYVVNQGSADAGKGFVGALSGSLANGAVTTGQSFQAGVSWLSAKKLGPGQFQPNFRVQGFDKDAGDTKIYDVGLGYIIDGFNHLWRVNYRHGDYPGSGTNEDSFQLGAQLML